MARVVVQALGSPLSVIVDGQPVTLHSRRSLALLTYLALEGRRRSRAELAASFWEDAEPATARANLRAVLSGWRRQLPGVVAADRDGVAVPPSADLEIDAVALVAEASAAGRSDLPSPDRIRHARRVLELHRGTLLPGFEDLGVSALTQWLEAERDALHQLVVGSTDLLVDLLLADGQAADAVAAASTLVALDEHRERSHLALARAFARAGEPHLALRQLDRARARIEGDLGLPVTDELLALQAELRHAGEGPDAFAMRLVDRFSPLPPTRVLLGRADLLDELARLPDGPGRTGRLITLTGAGGVGKTSVAVALAHRWRDAGQDAVFVDLSSLTDPAYVAAVVASALGHDHTDEMGYPDARDLVELIGERDLRIVLDNVEHLLPGPATVIDALLAVCPHVTVLATSRVPLRLAIEQVIEVPPLPVPPPDAADDELDRSPAVQLFEHRSRLLGVPAEPSERSSVAQICRLFDGHPLAIELAAARRRTLSAAALVQALAEDLPHGDLSMVDRPFEGAPARHRGLTTVISSSVELLAPRAKALFPALCALDGACPLDVVHAVCAPHLARGEALEALEQMVDLHLLRAVEHQGTTWFSPLPVVAAFGRSMLDEGQRARLLDGLDDHSCRLAVELEPKLSSDEAERWAVWLERYEPTLRATLDRLQARGDPRTAATLVRLAPHWKQQARYAEIARRLAALPAVVEPAPDRPSLAGELRAWRAATRAEAVGYSVAEDVVDEVLAGLAEVRATNPLPHVELQVWTLAAHVLDLAGRPDLAAETLIAAEGRAVATGHRWFEAELRYARAMLAHVEGDDAGAAALLRTVLAEVPLHRNRHMELYALMLADLIGVDGPAGGQTRSLAELLDLALQVGDRRQAIWLTVSLGAVALQNEDHVAAGERYLEALSLSRDADYFLGLGFCAMGGAALAVLRGDHATALDLHGWVEPHLDHLARAMPRAYVELYRSLVEMMEAAAATDPSLEAARATGAARTASQMASWLAESLRAIRAGAA